MKKQDKLNKILRNIFYAIIKPWVWLYIVLFQHVRFQRNGYKLPKGQILFLSNHLSNWDGVYLSGMFFNRSIRFVAHDELFKNKFFSWCAKVLLGEIKRGMKSSDISDVRQMKKVLKEGDDLGLYPEGDIGFFGRTLPIEKSVAKLCKLLGVSVVLTKIEGAGIRAPRWASRPRHTPITYSITDVISITEINALSVDELHERIVKGISGDDFAYQKQRMVKQFPSFGRAEWLQLGLFYCPSCQRFETLTSKNDKLLCVNCGLKVKYNRYSMLEGLTQPLGFTLLTEWDDLQRRALYKKIDASQNDKAIFIARDLDFYEVKQTQYFKKPQGKVALKIYTDKLGYLFDEKETFIFIKDMRRIILQHKDVLEIHYADKRIRFCTKQRKWSGYMYVKALEYLKEKSIN